MSATMKAATLVETGGPLAFTDLPVKQPGPGELLVRLESCGVCHSDVHYWKGEDSLPEREHHILGHEGVGVVAAAGPGATVAPGTRVGIGFVYSACDACRECRSGAETNCKDVRATGVSVDGCFAEYIVAPDAWVTAVPDGLRSADAAPLLCAGVTAFSAVRKASLGPGSLAVVFGLGGVGQYAVQFARLAGAKVIALDLDPAKLEIATRLGADLAVIPGSETTERILTWGGADACFSFAPAPAVMNAMIEVAAPRATLVQVALPPGPLSFHAADIIDKGLRIIGSADGSRHERDLVMGLAAAGRVQPNVTEIPFAQINDAIAQVDQGTALGRYVVNF